MIKNWLFTGDCHTNFNKFNTLEEKYRTDETAIIILGDVGINYYNDSRDNRAKMNLLSYGDYCIYCLRGNHDRSPESLNYNLVWDYDVNGWVYIDPDFSRIKYFPMTGYFNINHYTVGVIGGAYSVDKQYRLIHNYNWFEDEQLSVKELNEVVEDMSKRPLDLVLTHTCPKSWEPTDLFLPMVNQNSIDKHTEIKLDMLARDGIWENWLWGHFHADRDYPDGRRHMIMDKFKTLEEIVEE